MSQRITNPKHVALKLNKFTKEVAICNTYSPESTTKFHFKKLYNKSNNTISIQVHNEDELGIV